MEYVVDVTAIFMEWDLLDPLYVADEEIKNMRYYNILRDEIREFASILSCRTLEDMTNRAREWEIKLELQTKCKPVQVQTATSPAKRPKSFDSRSRGHLVRGNFAMCRRLHEGIYHDKGGNYFNCGQMGHYIMDCTRRALICFDCNHRGDMKVDCPRLSE